MKSTIRVEIENIMNIDPSTVYIDPTNAKKTKYRMKIAFAAPANVRQIKRIMALSPHILSVGYQNQAPNTRHATVTGLTIHFDCKPSLIQL